MPVAHPPCSTAESHKYGVLFVFAAGGPLVNRWAGHSPDRRGRGLANPALQVDQPVAVSLHRHSRTVRRKPVCPSPAHRLSRRHRRVGAGGRLFRRDLFDPDDLRGKCNAALCDGPFHGRDSWVDCTARIRARRNLDCDCGRHWRHRHHGCRQVRWSCPERQPCRSWIGAWLCRLHCGVALGADWRNAAGGVPVRPLRHHHHVWNMPVPGSVCRTQRARWWCCDGHGGLSGRGRPDPLHAWVAQSAGCRTGLAVPGPRSCLPRFGSGSSLAKRRASTL